MKIAPVVTLVALAFAACGCAIAAPIVQHSANQKAIAGQHVASDPQTVPVLDALRKLSGGVVGYQPDSFKIGSMDLPHLNAKSAGGGHFALTRGMLSIENPCLLWGVLAHELAHDILDHPAQQMRAQVAIGTAATAAAFIPFGGGLIAPIIIGTAGQAAMLGYSRAQEADADAKAVELLARAELPVWSLRYTLEFMRDVHGESGGGWSSSHPLTGERIAAQPPITAEEVAKLCPAPSVRATQVALARDRVTTWTDSRKAAGAELEKQSQENQRENQDAICTANRAC